MHPSKVLSQKVSDDEQFREDFLAIKAAAEEAGKSNAEYAADLMPLIDRSGIELTVEQVKQYLDECDAIELADEEIESVAAGGCSTILGVHSHGGTCVECPQNCVD